jgi:hypothetical protein
MKLSMIKDKIKHITEKDQISKKLVHHSSPNFKQDRCLHVLGKVKEKKHTNIQSNTRNNVIKLKTNY